LDAGLVGFAELKRITKVNVGRGRGFPQCFPQSTLRRFAGLPKTRNCHPVSFLREYPDDNQASGHGKRGKPEKHFGRGLRCLCASGVRELHEFYEFFAGLAGADCVQRHGGGAQEIFCDARDHQRGGGIDRHDVARCVSSVGG
jgi:hypothetical protein